nr:hypothetical protein [Tanacetum cinerariifolium]
PCVLKFALKDTTKEELTVQKEEMELEKNGNSLKPVAEITTNDAGISTTIIPGPVTIKEKAKKKIDVKARNMLLMANGNSLKPVAETTTNDAGISTTIIPGPVTIKEKAKNKIDVKARNMLLIAVLNEHLMTFNQYKDAKNLFATIETSFGRNEATKKTSKTLLKQLYENFSATSTKSLDSIFNRLQKLFS